MQKIKIAFVGCGAITRTAHLPAGLRSPLVDVAALVDSRVENARGLARMYGLDNITVTHDAASVIPDVDGVVVATPNDTHFAIAKEVLTQGKPVLIEKPITTTYTDAVTLCELADQNDTFISVGYRYRHFPSVVLLQTLLEEAYFGPVLGFHCEMGSRGGWAPVSGYNIERGRSGGGVLVINGTHFLDLILYWFGDPDSWRYEDDNYGNVEANCKGTLSFDNRCGRFAGSFFFSKTVELSNRFVIDTAEHVIEWSAADANCIFVVDKKRPDVRMSWSRSGRSNGESDYFRVQLEEFCRHVVRRGTLRSDGWSASRSVRLIQNMYRDATRITEDWLTYKTQT